MQTSPTTSTQIPDLELAFVLDAHNVGCLVRTFGDYATQRATYSDAIQSHGVVIRPCHIVAIDRRLAPPVVVWRLGTIGTITALDDGHATLDLGHRTLRIPLLDDRPVADRQTPLAIGDRVLLRGHSIEQAAITDVLAGDELAHPERLRAKLDHIRERLIPGSDAR